ncbi:hypothetical protein D3C72_986990 [compost metagenome]
MWNNQRVNEELQVGTIWINSRDQVSAVVIQDRRVTVCFYHVDFFVQQFSTANSVVYVFHYSDVRKNLNHTTFNWVDNGSRVQTLSELVLTGSFEVVTNSYDAEVTLRFFVVVFQTQVVLEYLQGTSRATEFVTYVVNVVFVGDDFFSYSTQSTFVSFWVSTCDSCNGSSTLLVFSDIATAIFEVLKTKLTHGQADVLVHLTSGATLGFRDVTEVFLADVFYQAFTFSQNAVAVVLFCFQSAEEVFHREASVLLLGIMFKQ